MRRNFYVIAGQRSSSPPKYFFDGYVAAKNEYEAIVLALKKICMPFPSDTGQAWKERTEEKGVLCYVNTGSGFFLYGGGDKDAVKKKEQEKP